MTQVQLPPKFQPHPEVAAGAITLDQAIMLIEWGWLSYEGACYVLPPRAWALLPQPKPAQVTQPKRWRWMQRLRNVRLS
jgi:hypothetical protein